MPVNVIRSQRFFNTPGCSTATRTIATLRTMTTKKQNTTVQGSNKGRGGSLRLALHKIELNIMVEKKRIEEYDNKSRRRETLEQKISTYVL